MEWHEFEQIKRESAAYRWLVDSLNQMTKHRRVYANTLGIIDVAKAMRHAARIAAGEEAGQ